MVIFTIGYEGLSQQQFISQLLDNGIDTVVDIREVPLSRKPGFSKKALANLLNIAGLAYVHISALGCPKPVRDRFRDDGDWTRYKKGFLKHLSSQGEAIAQLANIVDSATCALLCYEADYNFCHRSLVAEAVSEHSTADVVHIAAVSKIARLAGRQPACA